MPRHQDAATKATDSGNGGAGCFLRPSLVEVPGWRAQQCSAPRRTGGLHAMNVQRNLVLLALVTACGACAAVSVMLTSGMRIPLIHADEGSYLLNAFALAGRFAVRLGGDYYSGYSALLVPFAGGDAASLYRGALGVNVLMVALLPITYFLIVRAVYPGLGTWQAVASAVFAAFLPSHLYYTQLVFSDNLLVFAYAASLLALVGALRGGRASFPLAGIAGLLLAWCFLANPRGAFTGTAVVGTTLLVSLRYPAIRALSAVLASAWVLGCLAHLPLEALAGNAPRAERGYSVAGAAARLVDLQNLYNVLRNAAGVYVYTALAGIGLAGVTVVAAWRQLRSLGEPSRTRLPGAALIVIPAVAFALVAAMVMTAAFFAEPSRADHVIYGRYVAGVLGPVMALGFAALAVDRTLWRALLAYSVAALALVGLLAWSYAAQPPPSFLAPINVVEAYPFLHGTPGIDWRGLGLGIAAATATFLLLFRISPALAGAAGIVYFSAVAIWSAHAFLQPESMRQSAQSQFFAQIDAVAAQGSRPLCIDAGSGVDTWHLITYRLFLWRYLQEDAASCEQGLLLSADAALPFFEEGYRAVAMDLRRPLLLILPPGERLESMQRGSLIGPWALEALDADARAAAVEVVSIIPVDITAPLPFHFSVKVRNLSERILLHRTRSNSLKAAVRIGARLVPEDPEGDAIELRADLGQPLAPGAVHTAVLTIPKGTAPGRYLLQVGMVNEGVAWFGCTEAARCQFPIRIKGSAQVSVESEH